MEAGQMQHQHSHLPPSPPPSPPATRWRHKKKHADPFLDLGDARAPIPTPSPPSSPAEEQVAQQVAQLMRIILTPLLFTSFLVSLFLVNRSDRARRTSRTSTLLSYLSPSAWLDPEPYQDPVDTTWERQGSTTHVEPHFAISPRQDDGKEREGKKRRSWHLHKKIGRVAKLEVTDAFEMRGRVLVVMLAVVVWVVVGTWWVGTWMVEKVWR